MIVRSLLSGVGLLVLLFAASLRAQSPLLGELHRMLPAEFDTTTAVALADVDGDGDLDAFMGNSSSPHRLYLNDGSGIFAAASLQPPLLVDVTTAVATGDLDGDGDLDVLIGNWGTSIFPSVARLFLNDGSGVFTDATLQLPTGNESTHDVALGDVDGDGDLDAVLGNDSFSPDRLYLNDGSGVFSDASPQLTTALDATRAVELGDLDGDGDLDAFFGNLGPSRLYLNGGLGVFVDASSQLPLGTSALSAALGDVDGDGDLDLFVGGGAVDRLLLNDGGAVFTDASAQIPPNPGGTAAIELGDVDGDGDLDAVIGSWFANRLYLNDGTGTFSDASAQVPTTWGTYDLALGDVDGDGDSDVLVGSSKDALYLNDGAGVFTDGAAQIQPSDAFGGVAVGDVDGDGDLDVLVANHQPRLYRNVEGSGLFDDASGQFPSASLGAPSTVAVGDVDGDGDLDAVFGVATVGALPGGQDRLYLNDGTGVFVDASNQLPGMLDATYALAIGDVDGDGDLDLLLGNGVAPASPGSEQNRLYLNSGTGVFTDATAQVPSTLDVTLALALGDVDGDGDLDGVIGNTGFQGAQNRLWLNDGSGRFLDATFQLPPALDSTASLALGDVDGDGDVDILVGNAGLYLPEPNRLYLNDGFGGFSDASAQLPPGVGFTYAVVLGDVDGDQDLDALLEGAARLYLNDGTGQFIDASALHAGGAASVLAVGDLDGDGDLDAFRTGGGSAGPLTNLQRQLAWRGIPRVGKPLALDLYGPSWGAWFLAFSLGTANVPIPPFGTLRLDPMRTQQAFASLLDAEGRASIFYAVPADAALVGRTVYWQAIVAGPARFTNLEVTTLTNL